MIGMDFHDCSKLYNVPGIKVGRDPAYPERMWGGYLPGDEPGTCCEITNDPCDGNPLLSECAKMQETDILCPCNFEDEYVKPIEDILLWLNTEIDEYYCPEENVYYGESEIDITKKTLKEGVYEKKS